MFIQKTEETSIKEKKMQTFASLSHKKWLNHKLKSCVISNCALCRIGWWVVTATTSNNRVR